MQNVDAEHADAPEILLIARALLAERLAANEADKDLRKAAKDKESKLLDLPAIGEDTDLDDWKAKAGTFIQYRYRKSIGVDILTDPTKTYTLTAPGAAGHPYTYVDVRCNGMNADEIADEEAIFFALRACAKCEARKRLDTKLADARNLKDPNGHMHTTNLHTSAFVAWRALCMFDTANYQANINAFKALFCTNMTHAADHLDGLQRQYDRIMQSMPSQSLKAGLEPELAAHALRSLPRRLQDKLDAHTVLIDYSDRRFGHIKDWAKKHVDNLGVRQAADPPPARNAPAQLQLANALAFAKTPRRPPQGYSKQPTAKEAAASPNLKRRSAQARRLFCNACQGEGHSYITCSGNCKTKACNGKGGKHASQCALGKNKKMVLAERQARGKASSATTSEHRPWADRDSSMSDFEEDDGAEGPTHVGRCAAVPCHRCARSACARVRVRRGHRGGWCVLEARG